MEKLESAIQFALTMHKEQRDKIGLPFILHPLRVMLATMKHLQESRLKFQNYVTEEIVIAALLHDVVEDTTSTSMQQILLRRIDVMFGSQVAVLVDFLTRRKDQKETYRDFILRIKQHEVASLIKVHDLLDNLSRVNSLPSEEQGIEERYLRALSVLNDVHRPTWEQAGLHIQYDNEGEIIHDSRKDTSDLPDERI